MVDGNEAATELSDNEITEEGDEKPLHIISEWFREPSTEPL